MDAAVNESADDRRRARRLYAVEEHGILAVRIRPGRSAVVIDVSAGGALLETDWRLLPGIAVELQLETDKRQVIVRGRVLRSAVAALGANGVSYRGAVGFDRHLPWFADEDAAGYGVHPAESRPGRTRRADVTPPVI